MIEVLSIKSAILAIWGLLVGLVFSTVGAAGGILSSVGLISIAKIQDPNSVKVMSQILVLASSLIFIPKYFKNGALVWPLGVLLSAGGLLGAFVGSTVSTHYLSNMKDFKFLFALLAIAISVQLFWKVFKSSKKDEEEVKQVQNIRFKDKLKFNYGEKEFAVPYYSPVLAGFSISFLASLFGVGGGFLLVPYLSSFLGLPMHIVPATSAIAILISLVASISNFIALGAKVDYQILFTLLPGVLLGALFGPSLNRKLKNKHLQLALAIIIALIALKYTIW